MGRHLLVELTAATGDTAHLAVLHGTEVLYIDKEAPLSSSARLVTEVGVRLPAQITAVGRAMLAELPDAQPERFTVNNQSSYVTKVARLTSMHC